MKFLPLSCLVVAIAFVNVESKRIPEEDKQVKEMEESSIVTAKRKQFTHPEFTRSHFAEQQQPPPFDPEMRFHERPTRFQTPRELPEQDPRFMQPSEFVRRPVFIRERPQFEEPPFRMEPFVRHVRPQQVRTIEPISMFTDPHSFSLPASQFTPVRVHHPTQQEMQSAQAEKTPQKSASTFPTTFFNMPFSSVAMTPFKVTTASDGGPNKFQDSKRAEAESESLQQFVPQEELAVVRRPFLQSEPEFSSSVVRHRRPMLVGPQQFGGLRTSEQFPSHEFLEPFPPVRRPSFSQFEHPEGSSFEFRPEEASFGPPISFHVEPGQLDSLKLAQQPEAKPSKSKSKDEPKKSEDENPKSTSAISSGIKFRPFGVAPIHFQSPGALGSDALRSASTPVGEPQPGKSPLRPIILRPVKLLSPQGSDITKSASSVEDEFKAFMTVSDDDLQPMESSKPEDETLKARNVPLSQESDVVVRKPVVRRPVKPTQLVRVRPRDSESPKSVSKPSTTSKQEFRSLAPPSQGRRLRPRTHLRPVSSSFVEYRLQPSYIRSLRRGPEPSNLRATSRMFYEPLYYNPKLYEHDNLELEKQD